MEKHIRIKKDLLVYKAMLKQRLLSLSLIGQ